MKSIFLRIGAFALIAALGLAGCSQNGGTSAPTAAQQEAGKQAEAAQRNLDLYRQMLSIPNDEMAVSLGKDILRRFPGSTAAKEVQKTLPAIEKHYTAASESSRLARLWTYQLAPMAGGTQSTATIFSSQPSGRDRVRLVLRRHTSWGQSVFLYGAKPGFVCRGSSCTVAATVDGKSVRLKAFAPPSGEPALMFRDDKGFVTMLGEADEITLDVTLVEGEKKETLVYEVGGFDPAKWAALPKHKKK